MRHRNSVLKLGTSSASHRKSMQASLLTSLILHGKMKTTKSRALATQRAFDKLVSGLKNTKEDFNIVRTLKDELHQEAAGKKMKEEILPKFTGRTSGFTRITNAGFRKGDDAAIAIIEIV